MNLVGGAIGLFSPPVGIASGINSLYGKDIGAAVLGAAIDAGPRPQLSPPDRFNDLQKAIDYAIGTPR